MQQPGFQIRLKCNNRFFKYDWKTANGRCLLTFRAMRVHEIIDPSCSMPWCMDESENGTKRTAGAVHRMSVVGGGAEVIADFQDDSF